MQHSIDSFIICGGVCSSEDAVCKKSRFLSLRWSSRIVGLVCCQPKASVFYLFILFIYFFEKPRVRNETQKSTFLTNSTFERWLVDKQQTTDPAQYAWLHRVQFSATRILIRHGKLLDHIQFIWNYKLYFCSYCISSRCSDFIKSCFTLQKMLLSGK